MPPRTAAATRHCRWIFAKSITNASKLGAKYGIAGGFAYAGWYFSFPAAALVCYKLRQKGYRSLPEVEDLN